ncbi:hypothetical protein B9Z55_017983 [Caenorhabditis nigoni]|nr:hypothetical protein B9Z55_017983 [Caenorhabditis nigoni]
MIFYPKTIGLLFLLCSILLSTPVGIYLMFKNPSAKLQVYSEKSHEDAVWKLTGRRGYEYLVIDWTFCYPILMLKFPLCIFFIICIIAHRFYMKSIRHISNDCIDLGYNYTCNINRAFLSISLQIFIFVALPFLILDFTIFIRWELGVRALPVTFGCICTCLTTSITIFVHFRAYRRQVGYLFIALLRQNTTNFPIFISNQNHQSTQFQLSVMA